MNQRTSHPRRSAPRPVCMNRAGEPVTVHAHPARDRCPYCRRALPDPQGHRACQETCHARCVPGSPAPTWPATPPRPSPRYYPPALSWRLRRRPPYPAAAPPTPPSGTAIRSTGRLRLIPTATHRTEPQPDASPVAVSIYITPAASVRTNQHFKAVLSSAAGKPDGPSAHTPPPYPRPPPRPPRRAAARKPVISSASCPALTRPLPSLRPRRATPTRNAPASRSGTRRAVPAHAVSPALVLPPWNPPLRGAPFQKRNPPGGRTHPGGHSTALFRLCVAALHRERIQHLPKTAVAGHVHGLGGRHHSAAPPIPPTPQGSRAHRPFYELSPECPASCFGGQGRAETGSLHVARSQPLRGVRFADLML